MNTLYIYILFAIFWIPPSILSLEESKSDEKNLATRQKREPPRPPIYRHYIKHSYRTPPKRKIKRKPIYGPPPRPVYGPPKPKPIYGPPKPVYGSPSKPIYEPHSLIQQKPEYISELVPPPSDEYYLPPPLSTLQSHFELNNNNHNNYGTSDSFNHYESFDSYAPSSQIDYETPPPPQHFDHHQQETSFKYTPPSTNYGIPNNYETQTISYSNNPNFGTQTISYNDNSYQSYDSSYDIPTTFDNQPLSYDGLSASYGTPGALDSYGTPIHHQNYNNNNNYQINSNQNVEDYLFNDKNYDNSDTSASEKYTKVKLLSEKNIAIAETSTERQSNHNYDGPGIDENDFLNIHEILNGKERKKYDKMKQNWIIESKNSDKDEDLKIHEAFKYFIGKGFTKDKNIKNGN